MRRHPAATALVLIALVFVSLSVRPSAQVRTGIITGIVLDERQQPVARAQVQAFSVRTDIPQVRQDNTVPFSTRASGTASTDAEGRFQITGLELGDYLVAAGPVNLVPSSAPRREALYATTFYPSNIDYQTATSISAASSTVAPVRIQLVRVEGVRVAGSVVRGPGRRTTRMDVGLFRRFGGFGSGSTVAVVDAEGRFEIPRVPPGWYRLTIEPQQQAATNDAAFMLALASGPSESATMMIEVQDRDIDGLSLTLCAGAAISGRIVAEPDVANLSPVGMRVSAWPPSDHYSSSRSLSAMVTSDWTFRMTGLSGPYEFGAGSGRAPSVKATRITVDGVQQASTGVELTEGSHEVVVFVGLNEAPAPTIDRTLSSAALAEQFKAEKVFFRQFEIARELVERRDSRVLPSLAAWLSHEDRHVRGNAAFVFGGLGDPRGLQVISSVLTDRSDRPEGQGARTGNGDGRYRVEQQISTDRYYAVHLLGELRDRQAIPILIPLLKDKDVDYKAAWALGEIGDTGVVGSLLEALDDGSPAMRVAVIYALEALNAKEAVPRLMRLLDDHRRSNLVIVSEAAKVAIARLR